MLFLFVFHQCSFDISVHGEFHEKIKILFLFSLIFILCLVYFLFRPVFFFLSIFKYLIATVDNLTQNMRFKSNNKSGNKTPLKSQKSGTGRLLSAICIKQALYCSAL